VIGQYRHDVDRKPVFRALCGKEAWRAGASLAKMKVMADRSAGNRKSPYKGTLDEVLGGLARERGIEFHDYGAIEIGRRKQTKLVGLVSEPKECILGLKKGPRMRLERERRCRSSKHAGARGCGADDFAVAAVDAIEIAERDDSPFEGACIRAIANDRERGRVDPADHGAAAVYHSSRRMTAAGKRPAAAKTEAMVEGSGLSRPPSSSA